MEHLCRGMVWSLHPIQYHLLSQDARHAAEEEIYTNLNQKIDQFLQLADYDWMAMEPGSKASDYLVDLIGFLRSTFAVFTHLPVSKPLNLLSFSIQGAHGHLTVLLKAVVAQASWSEMEMGPYAGSV